MPPGVAKLGDWGLLDRGRATTCPHITRWHLDPSVHPFRVAATRRQSPGRVRSAPIRARQNPGRCCRRRGRRAPREFLRPGADDRWRAHHGHPYDLVLGADSIYSTMRRHAFVVGCRACGGSGLVALYASSRSRRSLGRTPARPAKGRELLQSARTETSQARWLCAAACRRLSRAS